MTNADLSKPFDVVIAGGGMVGATLALALHRQGRRVACVDPVSLDAGGTQVSPSFDLRATACALTSVWLFQNLGLWPKLERYAAPIENIEVSRQRRWGKVRMQAAEIQQAAFGYVIPNNAIGLALADAWASVADQNLLSCWGQKVTAATVDKDQVSVTLSNDQTLRCNLLVVADGARSALREQLGIAATSVDTQQQALVANLAVQKPRPGYAYERFTAAGPMALLPLTNARAGKVEAQYNLVWCGSAEDAEARLALPDKEFVGQLNKSFGAALGEITGVGVRQCFPVGVTAADAIAGDRVVMLGNAAQALHPVAGQGFNLGLRDVATLVDILDSQADCGLTSVTYDYAKARQQDRQQMLGLTTHLATSTALPEQGVMATVFGLGLTGFGQLSGAKQALALRASGLQKNLPRLCMHPDSSGLDTTISNKAASNG